MNTEQQHHKHYLGIQKSFEKAFLSYDAEAIIQPQAGTILIDCLAELKTTHQKTLDLGCGTGLTTMQLCKGFPISSLHINDFSFLLLKAACDRLRTFHAKPLLFNFDQQWISSCLYDLIFSNMAFQWSFDIYELFKKIHSHLNKCGILAFSLPLKESFFEIHPDQRIPLYSFDCIWKTLKKAGFKVISTDQFLSCQEFTTHLEALKSIKRYGANYVPQTKSNRIIDRSKLFLPSTLTYKIGVFIVSKESSG